MAREVLVVVIGILISLALAEVADEWRWKRETAEAKIPLTAELNRNLGRIAFISSQDACAERRLAEIESWLNSHRGGQPLSFNDNITARPVFATMSMSIWEVVKTGQIAAHMPLADKLAFARLYDSLQAYDRNQATQMETWSDLEELFMMRRLEDRDIARGLAMVTAIRYSRASNSRMLTARADDVRTLGLTPETMANVDPDRVAKLCARAI